MSMLNLGILAHVDAGKTSLTERLLFNAGIIPAVGSVDKGSTQTDTTDLERRRGITIQSAVVSFSIDDLTVNLIDTPGHSDFIAEVERALHVLDGAVLVVSAVEGVQSQTRVLMRTLTRLRIPVVVFVNKIDRMGARYDELLADIRDKLTPRALAMSTVDDIGARGARVRTCTFDDPDFVDEAAELLADGDDAFMTAYLDDRRRIGAAACRAELARQARQSLACPVYFGSAVTGAGVEALAAGVREHLPVASGAAGGEPRGSVFKVERGPAGEKIAYVRMRAGTLRPRTRPRLHRAGGDSFEGKVTAVRVFDRGAATRIAEAGAGAIAKVWGLTDVRIGDAVGSPDELHAGGLFAQPTLDTIIRPRNPRERPALHDALRVLSERDPLVDPRFDESGQDITVNLYGEVQKEVIAATLAEQFGVEVDFDETRTIYVERPVGVGEAVEAMGEEPSTHFYATIGLRVQPGPVGSGVAYGIEVERGSIPARFHKAIEETVRETLKQGLHGWGVIDCVITLIRSGSAAAVSAGKPPLSTTKEFRLLTPLVLMRALRQAGTQVLEPINRFELETPNAVSAEVLQELAKAGATVTGHAVHGATCRLTGTMRAQDVHGFERLLPALTQGESMFVSHLDGHRPISGDPPTRKRTDGDPLHLDSYLTHLHNQQ